MSGRPAGRGVFITFEGPDGSGKTTQMWLLSERLRAAGFEVFESAEPGGTPIGRQIRHILLNRENTAMSPRAELLLMFAARAQNVDQWILPALNAGQMVLSDRFTDSSLAYQGVGRGLGKDLVLDIDRIACRGLAPDLTICVDIDPAVGLARARSRNNVAVHADETRIDEEALEFHRKVRQAYRDLAAEYSERIRLIDGGDDPDVVAKRVWAEVERFLHV